MSADLLPWLHWARPFWLWALLAVPLILLWAWSRGRRSVDWQGQVDAHLLPHLLEAGVSRRARWPWAVVAGWVLAVLALAGPGWESQAQPLLQPQAPLVVALDLSRRITAADLPPSRLLQARAKLARLLQQREGGQLALLVYADDAYTVAPLTDDVANVALYLDALSPEVMPADGQRADRALDQAIRLLQRSGARTGRILLITDRADRDAIDAATQALSQGMRVSVLGLGTATGAAYRDGQGGVASAALDEPSLRQLARAGGGHYQRLRADDADLAALDVLRADGPPLQTGQGGGTQWRDQGYWLLPPLMLLALFAFRRRSAGVLVLALLVGMPMQQARAAAPADVRGAAQGTLWQRADQRQQQQMEQGVQAYRAGDYRSAQRFFSGIDNSEGWYNLGNTRARQGDLEGAIAAYDHALALQPGMADAEANRRVVDAARRRKADARQPGNQGQQGDKQRPGEQGRTGDDKQGNAQTQQGQTGPGQQQIGQSGQNAAQGTRGSGEPTAAQDGRDAAGRAPPAGEDDRAASTPPAGAAADPEQQQRADAQQRERMQQAMQNAPQAGADEDRQAVRGNGRTPQQREQQQAIEAWMRRVPDEPGELLRAKFELEAERRKREREW